MTGLCASGQLSGAAVALTGDSFEIVETAAGKGFGRLFK